MHDYDTVMLCYRNPVRKPGTRFLGVTLGCYLLSFKLHLLVLSWIIVGFEFQSYTLEKGLLLRLTVCSRSPLLFY